MIITKKHLHRRTFLKGMAGVTVGLPLLESMIPALSAQSKVAAKPQFRAAFVYTPHGVILDKWVPKTTGAGYEITPILKPIEAFRDRFVILSNLAENKGRQAGSGHASSSATWLSGAICKDTSGEDVHAGTTIDQMIASKIGQDTPIPSMELGIEDVSNMVGQCDGTSSCAYLNTMSWRTDTTPLPAEINPARGLRTHVRRRQLRSRALRPHSGRSQPARFHHQSRLQAPEQSGRAGPHPHQRLPRQPPRNRAPHRSNREAQHRHDALGPRCPRRHPGALRRPRRPDVRPASSRVPSRRHPHLHLHDVARAQQPHLSANRRARSAPLRLAPPVQPGADGEAPEDQHLSRPAVRRSS